MWLVANCPPVSRAVLITLALGNLTILSPVRLPGRLPMEVGLRNAVVTVGNLDADRDFTDVRDVVAAYWLLTVRAGRALYNVGGDGHVAAAAGCWEHLALADTRRG